MKVAALTRQIGASLSKLVSTPPRAQRRGKRILVACHDLTAAGGLYRFERVGRVLRRFDHDLAFVAFGETPQQIRTTDFPVLTPEASAKQVWDATFIPGAGFPETTIERFSELTAETFGVRVQHILNDATRKPHFLAVNRSFCPHVVIFNNRHWKIGDFTEFQADAFHFLEGAVDLERFATVPRRSIHRAGQPFIVGGLAAKNPELLIEAVRLCGEDVHLHLFGPADGLANGTAGLAAAGRLQLAGVLDERALGPFYAGVDCVAHVEKSAGWANLAAEGMASGVPVICTPNGTSAFAEHEKTALVVRDPSPQCLANAILHLKNDPAFGIRLARHARSRIRAFGWPAYAADLLRMIEKPSFAYDTWSPDLKLFGKWSEEQRLYGLDTIVASCRGMSVCDLGAGDGIVSRQLLHRGAAFAHGFDRDPNRVALAQSLCASFAGTRFCQADLSEWVSFEARYAADLKRSYDIVLYLGLHDQLPPGMRLQVLAGAAQRSTQWLAVRMEPSLFVSDDIGKTLAAFGFALCTTAPDEGKSLGATYVFGRGK